MEYTYTDKFGRTSLVNTEKDIRKELWIRIAEAYTSSSNSAYKEEAAVWADKILEDFDKRFGNEKR